jgi:hypothetical protein
MNSDDERAAQEIRRRERLAASLRENLKRRKAQQRARAEVSASVAPKDPPGHPGKGEG